MMKLPRILSFLLILIGFILIINSSLKTIVGNVVSESASIGSSISGLILIIFGIVLFLASQKGGGGNLEKKLKVISSKRFERSIRRQPKEEIDRALEKLGTGLANEEYLKYSDKWSIRVSKGGRILYDRTPTEIVLYEYSPPGEHP